jgi:hypothetical protein
MKIAQLIKETETHLFKNEEGEVLNLTVEQKLMHSIFKPELCVHQRTEEVVERWRYKTKKEVDLMFWNYIKENNLNSTEYYIVYTEQ